MAVRAKVICKSREAFGCWSGKVNGEVVASATNGESFCNRTFVFEAVISGDSDENKSFSRWTPSLQLTMNVTNPDCDFEPGREYYLDFVRAPRANELPETITLT